MKEQLLKIYYKPLSFNDLLQKAIAEISEAMQDSKNSINLNRNLYTHQVISYLSKEGFEIDGEEFNFVQVP